MDDSSSASHEPHISNGVEAARHDLLDISSNAVAPSLEERAPINGVEASSHQDDDITDPQLQISNEEDENLHVVLAMNEAMSELIDNMILKAEDALRVNREKQKVLEDRKKALSSSVALTKRKVPVSMFMPPYFKDQFDMCPPQNAELKRKMECMVYDPLLKPERVWTAADLRTLHEAVREAMLEERLMPLYAQRELLQEKIRAANATTTPEERKEWTHKMDAFNRKIDYEKTLTDRDLLTGDYRNVDWAKIAMVNFKGFRSPMSICLKWTNEQSPQWSKEPWTVAEVKRLHELSRTDFISWSLIADKLGTRRTPWQCFEKYKSELSTEILKREWTQDEDDRLVKLVESLQLNGVIMWDKVTYHMVGRTRQQCRNRYLRTLDKSIKHGRWTDEEDLLLMCSIGRYGAKDWRKIAKGVPGRNDAQCRERWVNVLDRANRSEEWSMEEDEKLLYAVNMFGKGKWAQVATVMPGRNQRACKARFRSLLTTRMRITAAQLSQIREAQALRRGTSRCHLKRRSEATFKEFNQLVGGNDETGESFCNRARSVALADSFRYKQIEPEVARVVEEGMQDIAMKYDGRVREGELDDDGHTQELFDSIEASGRRAMTLLPVEFDPEVTEEDKCQRLTEALCQVVGGLDQLHAISEQEAIETKADVRTEIEWRLRRLLIEAVDARVAATMSRDAADEGPMSSKAAARQAQLEESIRSEMRAAANDMLHPTAATMHAAELLIADLPRLAEVVQPLVTIPWGGERVHSTEEMLARLEAQLKHSKEFLELKEILRCLLIEPFQLAYSLEDDERQIASLTEQFNSMRDQLLADVNTEEVERRDHPKSPRKKPPTMKKQPLKPKDMRLADILATLPPAPPPSSVSMVSFTPSALAGTNQKASSSKKNQKAARSSVWDERSSDDELPMDWEEEEEEEEPAAPTSSKKPPAKRRAPSSLRSALVKEEQSMKRTRSTRNSMSTTPVPLEEEDEEEEQAPPPAKKSRSRARKSATPAAKEQGTVAKDTVEGEQAEQPAPAKRGRGRPSKASKATAKVTVAAAVEEDTVEETEEAQQETTVPREDTVDGEEQEEDEEATVSAMDTVEPENEEGQEDMVSE